MARTKKILFRGVEDGHKDAETQFFEATGQKFNPKKHEIKWVGAEQSDDYGSITKFEIVNKSKPRKKKEKENSNEEKNNNGKDEEVITEKQEKNEEVIVKEQGKEEKIIDTSTNNKENKGIEVKWHPKLTPEQKEELIAEGIEPGDNEYDMYLWNHGINPTIEIDDINPYKDLSEEELREKISELGDELGYEYQQGQYGLADMKKIKDIQDQINAMNAEIERRKHEKNKETEVAKDERQEQPTPPKQPVVQISEQAVRNDIKPIYKFRFDSKTSQYIVETKLGDKIDVKTVPLDMSLFPVTRKQKDAVMARKLRENERGGVYTNIFTGGIPALNRNKIKNYDPQIILILMDLHKDNPLEGVKACRQYLEQLEKKKNGKKEKLGVAIEYNMEHLDETKSGNKKLSLFEKLRISRIAKAHTYIANVEKRKRFSLKNLLPKKKEPEALPQARTRDDDKFKNSIVVDQDKLGKLPIYDYTVPEKENDRDISD